MEQVNPNEFLQHLMAIFAVIGGVLTLFGLCFVAAVVTQAVKRKRAEVRMQRQQYNLEKRLDEKLKMSEADTRYLEVHN
jgi:hypothetical protein